MTTIMIGTKITMLVKIAITITAYIGIHKKHSTIMEYTKARKKYHIRDHS